MFLFIIALFFCPFIALGAQVFEDAQVLLDIEDDTWKEAKFLAKAHSSQIPGNPDFISQAGQSELYKNLLHNKVVILEKFANGAGDEPTGANYLDIPDEKLAAVYFQRSKVRSAHRDMLVADEYGLAINPYANNQPPRGRGFYYDHGPNQAADPLVVRYLNKKLQLLVVQRPKREWNNKIPIWALPGGMRDKVGLPKCKVFEEGLDAAAREAREETGLDFTALKPLFEVTYEGYVDDPRATSWSWPETIVNTLLVHPNNLVKKGEILSPDELALRKHCVDNILTNENLVPKDSDECPDARWMDVTEDNVNALFASHGLFVRLSLEKLKLPISY